MLTLRIPLAASHRKPFSRGLNKLWFIFLVADAMSLVVAPDILLTVDTTWAHQPVFQRPERTTLRGLSPNFQKVTLPLRGMRSVCFVWAPWCPSRIQPQVPRGSYWVTHLLSIFFSLLSSAPCPSSTFPGITCYINYLHSVEPKQPEQDREWSVVMLESRDQRDRGPRLAWGRTEIVTQLKLEDAPPW